MGKLTVNVYSHFGEIISVFRYMSNKFVKEGKMSVDFMREKEKMLTLLGRKRCKEQSKNKLKKICSMEEKDDHENQKHLCQEETADNSGPKLKRMKVDVDETTIASTGRELATQEEPPSDIQATVVEQKIETQILEGMEDVLGVKE
jgi:hypothetical protein